MRELSRIMPDSDEEVTIYPEKRHGMFSFGSVTVITRLLEGEFLNYRTAVPGDMPICLQINKMSFRRPWRGFPLSYPSA